MSDSDTPALTELANLRAENRRLRIDVLRHAHRPRVDWSWKLLGCRHEDPKHEYLCGTCGSCHPCPAAEAVALFDEEVRERSHVV